MLFRSFNAKVCGEKYAAISKQLGFEFNTTEQGVEALVTFVTGLNKAMNIPSTLKEFGIEESLFLEHLDSIAENALADPCTGTNPREISLEQMTQLFKTVYYG